MATDDTIREVLSTTRTWAVVGASPSPGRPSHGVARFLMERGYRMIPVNPTVEEVLGQRCYPDLASIPETEQVDVVDIFRRSELAGEHVDEAIAIGAKAVWMQLGVVDPAAAARAEGAGLEVVMDRCPAIEHPRLGI
ncbi:MAG: CoA-binding protein [Solirubrobacterales bacterium]